MLELQVQISSKTGGNLPIVCACKCKGICGGPKIWAYFQVDQRSES